MHRFKDMQWQEKAFALPTIAVLAFGIMGYFLGELCGSYLDEWQFRSLYSIINSLLYDKYLLWLALSIAVGVLLFRGMAYLCKPDVKYRWLRITLAVLLTTWNIFMTIICIVNSASWDDLTPIYEKGNISWYVSRSEEIQRMQSKSVWFGRGEQYYTYPEYLYEEADDVISDVMDKEQTKAYFAFVRWRSEVLLPVLTYCFGKWVKLLYFTIVPLWFMGAIIGFTAVKGKGRKSLYGSCMCLVGIQLLLTILDCYGMVTWPMPLLFSTADWTAMIPIVVIQLTVMSFLIKISQKSSEPENSTNSQLID